MPTLTNSPAAISDTSSAPQRRSAKTLFAPSQYALASSPDGLPGEWGGIALKPFPTRVNGERVQFKVGDRVPAEVARSWPIPNRMAMQAQRLVRYFETAKEAEQMSGAIAQQTRRNPERSMMVAAAAAEKPPQRSKAQAAKIAASQKKRLATLALKKAQKAAEALLETKPAATPASAVEETQPTA